MNIKEFENKLKEIDKNLYLKKENNTKMRINPDDKIDPNIYIIMYEGEFVNIKLLAFTIKEDVAFEVYREAREFDYKLVYEVLELFAKFMQTPPNQRLDDASREYENIQTTFTEEEISEIRERFGTNLEDFNIYHEIKWDTIIVGDNTSDKYTEE